MPAGPPGEEARLQIGDRIHVIGNSCSGKSTVGARISRALALPLVDLDGLNWLPDWVPLHTADPAEFERRIREATSGDRWVVAGSYRSFAERIFWPRLDTVVWLDLPLPQLVVRVLVRSWRRWRSKELLWGSNLERFWPQLMLWRGNDSLLFWILTQHRAKRRTMISCMNDPRWARVKFIRLGSSHEVDAFTRSLQESGDVPGREGARQ